MQEDLQPDLTLWFDLPAQVAASRRAAARHGDRFEEEDCEFFNRVRSGYQSRAALDEGRFRRVDAEQDVPAVARQIEDILEKLGW